MKFLFVHQNFPGQFTHLAPELVKQGHDVHAWYMTGNLPSNWLGVRTSKIELKRASTENVHPWVADIEAKVLRGEAVLQYALAARSKGFAPDAVIAHSGWGEALFLKMVWPDVRLGVYAEYYYTLHPEITFDPDFDLSQQESTEARLRMKNIHNDFFIRDADALISPTGFQANTFPMDVREGIRVIHDGIDTDAVKPNDEARMGLQTAAGVVHLDRSCEVVTFVNRNLEPYRGFPQLMRTLPRLLQERPHARVLIVGGDRVSYGPPPADGSSWRRQLVEEIRPQMSDSDWSRVHFLGQVTYREFVALLQISTVHVYLTYPFVLSWSLLEAMSAGCAIVASNTPPVAEVMIDGETGLLVPFFDTTVLGDRILSLLAQPAMRQQLGAAARRAVVQRYDLKTVCLPAQLEWIAEWTGSTGLNI